MKILVIGDSHGNITNLKHVMGFAEKILRGVVIHCGDWNTPESVETVLSYNVPLYAVLGNADVDPTITQKLKIKSQKFSKDFLEFEINGRKVGVTHKPSDNKKYFTDKKLDVIFNGHLHSCSESRWRGIKVFRPGATISGINFAVYDTLSDKIEFVNE
jgi:hypothetical protein